MLIELMRGDINVVVELDIVLRIVRPSQEVEELDHFLELDVHCLVELRKEADLARPTGRLGALVDL